MAEEAEDETQAFVAVTDETQDGGVAAQPDEQAEADSQNADEGAETTDQGSGEDAESGDADDASANRPRRSAKKRIGKAIRAQREAERRAEELERELAKYKSQSTSSESSTQPSNEPNPDDYDDHDQYLEDLANFYANDEGEEGGQDKQEASESQGEGEDAADEQDDPELATAADLAADAFDEAREKYSDFDEVALADDVPVTREMFVALANAEHTGDIAYYLGQNRQEAARIADLSATQQAIEIGKIEATLAKGGSPEPRKKTTEAPEPVEPVNGSAPPSKAVKDMTFPEYEAYMNQQESKGGFW